MRPVKNYGCGGEFKFPDNLKIFTFYQSNLGHIREPVKNVLAEFVR